MEDSSRRSFLKVLGGTGALGATSLAGCTGLTGGGGGTNIGMVYALGGLGDKSFNDMANRGVKNAKDELGISFDNAEPGDATEIKTLQRKFAQSSSPNYDLICCIGFTQTSALQENADSFSDQKFMLVDSAVDFDNVANYVFKEEEGSFQVGYLAGQLTKMDFSAGAGETNGDKVVGFVGGKKNPLIQKFQAGYMAGAKHADSSIEIRSAYAGSWSDPAKGKSIALSMYDEGADIVYHAAGGTGTGVFQAAKDRGRYAIGVDSDQSKSASKFKDVILASMVKHVDTAVYESIENVTNDEFNGGSTTALGLSQDGVEAVLGQQLGSEIPSGVKNKLDDSRSSIENGDISIPTKPGNV